MSIVSFPTQGEVLQCAFDVFGVLPRKHEQDERFDETKKRTTQVSLRRLAKEVGQLDQNIGKLISTFSYLVAGALPSRGAMAFGEVFFDLFSVYRDAVRKEGTFLTKSETTKWLLLERGALRLAISLAKQVQRFNVAADGLLVPGETYWYLPTREGETWRWPLERVMRWSYELAETSIHRFHCPEEEDMARLGKNLASAKNWLAGRHPPSWSSLLKNFEESFTALDKSRTKKTLPLLSETHKKSIRTALFLSRAATYISMLVLKHFGAETLEELCKRYRLAAVAAADNTLLVRTVARQLIARKKIPENEWDYLWFEVVTAYWTGFVDRQDRVSQALASGAINVGRAIERSRRHGRLAVLQFERPDVFAPGHSVPEGFGELLCAGLGLQKSSDLSLSSIDTYRARLEKQGLVDALPWMVPWQQSTYHYRRKEYAKAYPYIREAFEAAQYCAGTEQYLLLNQYIELSAKNDRRKEFTQGVRWATYLGFEVRLLRQQPQTKENLESVFKLMKVAVYPF